jgi:formate/nitrite transporter FocA (FNT family)
VWAGDISFADMMLRFEIPALIGNIIGGVVLVALLNHGQTGSKGKREPG